MPTYQRLPRFRRDFSNLSPGQQRLALAMLRILLDGLQQGRFDPRLRVKRVQGHEGIWEISWAPDGRVTFAYGPEVRLGEPHIIWRRIGTHDIFREP
ncbi:MAG: hypothetical protein ACR2PL_23350 [Dehalococcoidia bacterium]